MIEEVVSIELPVHERMVIKKNRLTPKDYAGEPVPRISIVTGIHGDELDGQYVCYEVIRRVNNNLERLKGIIDIYPDVNPLGIDTGSRGIPMFELDMNRVFPGDNNGAVAESVAAGIVNDIIGSDFCLDIHSSNIFVREMPQVRLNEENAERLLLAKHLLLTSEYISNLEFLGYPGIYIDDEFTCGIEIQQVLTPQVRCHALKLIHDLFDFDTDESELPVDEVKLRMTFKSALVC